MSPQGSGARSKAALMPLNDAVMIRYTSIFIKNALIGARCIDALIVCKPPLRFVSQITIIPTKGKRPSVNRNECGAVIHLVSSPGSWVKHGVYD